MVEKTRIYNENVSIDPENTRELYDKRAKSIADAPNPYVSVLLDDQNPENAEKWNAFEKEYILPLLQVNEKNNVLDIGCGIGRWAESLIPICRYYCGTDFSSKMIDVASERNRHPDKKYSFKNLSFQEVTSTVFKPENSKFDRIIIAGICMYINDDELLKCFEGLLNLLAPQCIMYLTETVGVENRLTLNRIPSQALKSDYDAIYRTSNEYNKLYEIFTDEGFNVKKQDYLPRLNDTKEFSETERWYTILER